MGGSPDTARANMIKARAELLLEQPFFGSMLLRLELRPDPECGDVWTDGRVLGYNPAYASSRETKHLVCVQAHEVLHLALKHHVRRNGRNPELWNRACDVAVNHILAEQGFSLPENYRLETGYADMSVDAVYAALTRLQDEEAHGGAKDAEAEEGSSKNGQGAGDPEGGGSDDSRRKPEKGGSDPSGPEQQGGKASPARQTEKTEQGKQQSSPAAAGEVRDHPLLKGKNEQEARRAAEREADINLVRSLQSAPGMGFFSGGLERLVRQTLRPQLDWREILRRFVENSTDNDYSWGSPNRRYLWQDLYLPTRREMKLPRIALAVDTSGSIDENMLDAFCAELSAILEDFDTELTVLFHDARLYPPQTFTRDDLPLHLTPPGGGGTDYRPVCAGIEQLALAPACLLWFTDFQCNLFPEPPDFPVLWCASQLPEVAPPFGDVVQLA